MVKGNKCGDSDNEVTVRELPAAGSISSRQGAKPDGVRLHF